MNEDFINTVKLKVPEISLIPGELARSQFIPEYVHARLISQSQVDLAKSIALANTESTLLSSLHSVPRKWIWERTDSVMWLTAFENLARALSEYSKNSDLLIDILSALEVLLIDSLAESSFRGWSAVMHLIDSRLLAEATDNASWKIIFTALRVLRRHPLLLNPRKITRQSPVVGGGGSIYSIPLFVVDITPSCKAWMERAGCSESPLAAEGERLRQLLSQFGFGMESLCETQLAIDQLGFAESIPGPISVDAEDSGYVKLLKKLAEQRDPEVCRTVHACRLAALEMLTLMKPRFLSSYLSTYPGLLAQCCRLACNAIDCKSPILSTSVNDFLGTVIRETSHSETVSRFLGLVAPSIPVFPTHANSLIDCIKSMLLSNHEMILSSINLFGSKCLSLAGLSQAAVAGAFIPWLSNALIFVSSPLAQGALVERIFLCRLFASVMENSGSQALAQQFKDMNGFALCSNLLNETLSILTGASLVESEAERQALGALVRSSLRLVEVTFKALELAGVGANGTLLDMIGFKNSFVSIFKSIFDFPEQVSVGTVALSASVLTHLISHDPVCVVELVKQGVVKSVAKVCEHQLVLESPEALSSMAQCLGTLCVHAEGEKALITQYSDPLCNHIIPAFGKPEISSFWITNPQLIDMNEFNPGVMVGTALDELIRNRPHLRDSVLEAVVNAGVSLGLYKNPDLFLFSDSLNATCRLVEAVCANAETCAKFQQTMGLEALMIAGYKIPWNFTHVIPSHGLCRLVKLFASSSSSQQDKSPSSAHWALLSAQQTSAVIKSALEKFKSVSSLSVLEFFAILSPLHLVLHSAAIAIKDVPPAMSPAGFQHLSDMLGELARLREDLPESLIALMKSNNISCSNSVFSIIAGFASLHVGAKSEEEKELRRRLRDERMHAESFFTVFGMEFFLTAQIDEKNDHLLIEKELVRGLWMVVRGFMCQVARVVNYPSAPRQNRRTLPSQTVAENARVAAWHLAVLANQLLDHSQSPVRIAESVDLLCRLHVEDKHHMTRSLCLDVFYKLGGVDRLLTALDECCKNLSESMEAMQGILWWFERTTSLKRLHNAQLTFLLQKEGDDYQQSSSPADTQFDAISLVSSLQHDFAKNFAPHWRNDECLAKLSSKAAASLLKAFTHVLEPNETLFSSVFLPSDQISPPLPGSKLKAYALFPSVIEEAKKIAIDFMERTLVLGASDNTAAVATQTHIADVCVRLSHNRLIKLGPRNDEELVKQLQRVSSASGGSGARYRADTVTLSADEILMIDSGLAERTTDLASVETEGGEESAALAEEESDSAALMMDFSIYNSRHIADMSVKAALDSDSSDSKRRIACTVIACILHARADLVRDVLESFPAEFLTLSKRLSLTEPVAIPAWVTPGLVIVDKLLLGGKKSGRGELFRQYFDRLAALLAVSKESQTCEALLRVLDNCSKQTMQEGTYVDGEMGNMKLREILLKLPKLNRFEGIQNLSLIPFGQLIPRMMGKQLALSLVQDCLSELLESAGTKGVKLSRLAREARLKLSSLNVINADIPGLIAEVVRGKVAWKLIKETPKIDQNEDEDVKRIKISSPSSAVSNLVIAALPETVWDHRPVDSLPAYLEESVELLASGLVERVSLLADGKDAVHALNGEDLLYILTSILEKCEGTFLMSANEESGGGNDQILSPVLIENILDPLLPLLSRYVDAVRSSGAGKAFSEANGLIQRVFRLVSMYGGKNHILVTCVWELVKQNFNSNAMTLGQLVLVHKALAVAGANTPLDVKNEIKLWGLRGLENPENDFLQEGLIDLLELVTRPLIVGESNRSNVVSDENTPLLSAVAANGDSVNALLEAIENGGASGGILSINVIQPQLANTTNEASGTSILGEAPANEEAVAAESQVLEVVRRTLSPLVSVDSSSQFPRFYTTRTRNLESEAPLSTDDFLSSSSSVFFDSPDHLNLEWSFDPLIVTPDHPLIARSHTGSASSPRAAAQREMERTPPPLNESRDDEISRLIRLITAQAPRLPDSQEDPPDFDHGEDDFASLHLSEEEEAEFDWDQAEEAAVAPLVAEPSLAASSDLLLDTGVLMQAQTSGIAALSEAARRLQMTESDLISSTGIDPSVLRDIPEFMHAEVIREFIGPFLSNVRRHHELHIEEILTRERRQQRRRRILPPPARASIAGLNLLAQLQARVGSAQTDARLMVDLIARHAMRPLQDGGGGGNGVLLVDSFPPLPTSNELRGVPKLSSATVERVCSYYDDLEARGERVPTCLPVITGEKETTTPIEIILTSVLRIDSARGRTVAENLLFNLSLVRSQRDIVLNRMADLIEQIRKGSFAVKRGGRGPESAAKAAAVERLLSLSLFLFNHIPTAMDWVASASAVDRFINLLVEQDQNSNSTKLLLDILHLLLVPLKEDVPPTTRRHRQRGHSDSKVDKVQVSVSNQSVKQLIDLLFSRTHRCDSSGMEIVTALGEIESHSEFIRSSLGNLLCGLAQKVRQDLDASVMLSIESVKLLEAVKLLRSLKPRSLVEEQQLDRFIACPEMHALWVSLDAGLGRLQDRISLNLSDLRHLFPVIEVFFISNTSPKIECEPSGTIIKLCESHRKILNLILSENPDLLFGSFSQIVLKCPWVLEFDNKRRYFRQTLRNSQDPGGVNQIKLSVRRSEVFMDSYYQLRHRSAAEMKGKLSVQFTGEEGVDAGGLVREWFGILSREIFNPNYALFRTAGGKASTFHPNPMSFVNPDHLSFFEFCGRVVGKAIFDDQRLDAYFARSFYKHMLHSPVTWMDFEVEDPDYYKQLQWIIATDLDSPEAASVADHLAFTVDVDEFGHVRSVDLIPGGSDVPVTQANKKDYVRLVCEYKMTTSITPQVESFMKGFHELIPPDLLGSLFDDKELELLISGLPAINLSDLKANTEYVNYSVSSPQIQWLWKLLDEEFSQEQLAWFLQFVTGSTQVPLEGFKALVGMRGPQKFSVHKAYGSHRLPTAHTCFNQLDLPEYDNPHQLRDKLIKAVTEAHEGFGFI